MAASSRTPPPVPPTRLLTRPSFFGLRFIKVQPTTYLLQYKRGRLKREGAGLAFHYYAPTTSLVAVPISSNDAPFIFHESTADFQELTVQGQVTFRVADPKRVAALLNFTLDAAGQRYAGDDPDKLPERVVNLVQVLTSKQVQRLTMRQALRASDAIVANVRADLLAAPEMAALGLEVLGLSILAIKPTPESARALEAEAREQLLKEADDALYRRRNASIAQERAIKENELGTELAVELKRRQIRDAEIDTERSVLEKRNALRAAELTANTELEEANRQLVALRSENLRTEADAKAYGIAAAMRALADTDPKTVQALASIGMQPDQLIAVAFGDLATRAERIGQLNLSPDLLRELLGDGRRGRDGSSPGGSGGGGKGK